VRIQEINVKNKFMKYLIITFVLIISTNTFAQKNGKHKKNKNVFIRIYDLEGKKINKGKIKFITETSIELELKGETIEVPLSKIGKIKTKRSGGNNIAKGALIGGGSLAVLGLLSGDDEGGFISFSATDKASLGLIGGGFFGAIYGGISILFKKSKRFIIDGNEMKLNQFKEQMIKQKLLIETKQ